MTVLGIETSCDETAAAVVTGEGEVRASVVASQLALHAPYGGIVPELASRQHLRDLPRVAAEALRAASLDWSGLDGVAATHGPGLIGALWVGLTWAKAAAWARGLPFIGVNHLEGHLSALDLETDPMPRPFAGLVASGGHTSLFVVGAEAPRYRLLAQTRDDAVGEAFDKVAKLLGLGYPGGPAIERAARASDPNAVRFGLPRMKDGIPGFSYSGLKTAVRYHLDRERQAGRPTAAADIAAAFQRTIVRDVTEKTVQGARAAGVRAVGLTGGVAANQALRQALADATAAAGWTFRTPPVRWCTDNAAMIALAGARRLAAGERSPWDLPAVPNLALA